MSSLNPYLIRSSFSTAGVRRVRVYRAVSLGASAGGWEVGCGSSGCRRALVAAHVDEVFRLLMSPREEVKDHGRTAARTPCAAGLALVRPGVCSPPRVRPRRYSWGLTRDLVTLAIGSVLVLARRAGRRRPCSPCNPKSRRQPAWEANPKSRCRFFAASLAQTHSVSAAQY